MAARIEDQFMTAEYDGRVAATARYSPPAAAGGQTGWVVSGLSRRLLTRKQAITAMVLAERLAAGRWGQPVPRLAAWSLGTGICAAVGANLAHGVGHGPVGALVSAWADGGRVPAG